LCACREQLEKERKLQEERRAAAEKDTSRVRALHAMMNNKPDRRKPDAFENLKREPWMDMPLKSMTKAQREALRDFDKKVQEVEEGLRNAVRIAEGERKTLEEEIMAAIIAFNAELRQLSSECDAAKMRIAVTEQTRLAIMSSVLILLHAQGCIHSFMFLH
jgi:hypothetical protein